ncbi:hypothetical protein, partial [Cellulomonas hominis]|uniref:hypothetical protein n=1 Tax=Cellulomonas hominis TaxID=156981 RepID=UPI001BCC746E
MTATTTPVRAAPGPRRGGFGGEPGGARGAPAAATYFSDAAATTPTADPAQAAAFRVAFRSALDDGGTGLRAGSNGSLRFDSVLVAP